MKFTLRDFFLLQILATIACCWAWEHSHLSKVLEERKILSKQNPGSSSLMDELSLPTKVSDAAKARRVLLNELQSLSNEALLKRTKELTATRGYKCCLTELARREMHKELQELDNNSKMASADGIPWPRSAELLTAIRRAQGRRDPLKIRMEIPRKDITGHPIAHPELIVTIENVDELHEPFIVCDRSDAMLRDQWRIRLTDQKGHIIENSISHISYFLREGSAQIQQIEFGRQSEIPSRLNLHNHLARPAAGSYQLSVIFCEDWIATEPDLNGLIVWQSDAMRVHVESWETSEFPITAIPVLGLSMIACVVIVFGNVRRSCRQSSAGASIPSNRFLPRDLVYVTLIFVLTYAWAHDSQYMKGSISAHHVEHSKDWTIRAA